MAGNLQFDVAACLPQQTLNFLIPQIYSIIHEKFLKKSVKVNEFNITTIDFDIQTAPTVTLQQPSEAKAYFSAALQSASSGSVAKLMGLSDEIKEAFLNYSSSATFSVNVPKMALTIHYKGRASPTKISAKMTAQAAVSVDASDPDEPIMIVTLLAGAVSIPNNPLVNDLLNKAFVPYLISYLNKNVLNAIKIPVLGYKSIKYSIPVPAVQDDALYAFSCLGSSPAIVPPPGSFAWPEMSNGVFIAADVANIDAAAGLIFPLGPQENFSWNIISGHVGATVNKPIASITDGGGLVASIEANISATLTLHTPSPFPNVNFGPSASAIASVGLTPAIRDGVLVCYLASIPFFSFSFQWFIPNWISWFFDPIKHELEKALNSFLEPLIDAAFRAAIPNGIPIMNVPGISFNFKDGPKVVIKIDNAVTKSLHKKFLLVGAEATVSKE